MMTSTVENLMLMLKVRGWAAFQRSAFTEVLVSFGVPQLPTIRNH
jgi:hypothetical protein